MNSNPFRKIGLTGGVASGKTAVADLLRAAGLIVINLDEIGRELTENDPNVQARLGQILGGGVYENSFFDRRKAREILFADAAKRKEVEAVLHPKIEEEFERRAQKAREHSQKLVICEAALLMEAGVDKKLDAIVLVSAPEDLRTRRVLERDQIGAVLAEKMIRTQLRDTDRPAQRSSFAIENTGSLADLSIKVTELLADWKDRGWL